MTVHVVGATVICGACDHQMRPVMFRELVGEDLDWLFWRCTGNPDHVTVRIPLPAVARE